MVRQVAKKRVVPSAGSAARRRPGKRAGLDLAQIIKSARALDPRMLTMQAVADDLGVDRKALNHHVFDRETLLRLVAQEAFVETFSAVELSTRASWQDACRLYALGYADSVIATGVLVDHLEVSPALVTRFLQTTEALTAKLISAGFSDEAAVRALALLSNICTAFARDAISVAQSGKRRRQLMLRSALAERSESTFVNLSRIAVAPADTYGRPQLSWSVEVFIRGMEHALS
jgi:TetR/AcrR family transcriptional regulator, tetracycline repressor protein